MNQLTEHTIQEANEQRSSFYLGGQEFYLAAPIILDPISDFAQGIKTGPVDYDQRLHSFFQAVDDHSGGIGYGNISLRNDLGVFSHSPLGADSRRSHHLHAPPFIQKIYSNHTVLQTYVNAYVPQPAPRTIAHIGANMVLFAPGAAFYSSDGYQWIRSALATSQAGKIIRTFIGDVAGVSNFFVLFRVATTPTLESYRSADGITWTAETDQTLWDVTHYEGWFWALGDNGITLELDFPDAAGGLGLPPGPGMWVGSGNTPAGPGLFFIKSSRLWYVTKFSKYLNSADAIIDGGIIDELREAVVIPGFNIVGAIQTGDGILLHDGYNMILYTVSGFQQVVRSVGFQEFRDLVPQLAGGRIRAATRRISRRQNQIRVPVDVGWLPDKARRRTCDRVRVPVGVS